MKKNEEKAETRGEKTKDKQDNKYLFNKKLNFHKFGYLCYFLYSIENAVMFIYMFKIVLMEIWQY